MGNSMEMGREDGKQAWQMRAKAGRKQYERLLKQGDKKGFLKVLPILHQEAFERIDCLDCGACCRGYSPRFKSPDLRRISRFLKIKESELIDRYLVVDEEEDFVFRSLPCPFIEDNNHCQIYEVRPGDCRRFPYTNEDTFYKKPSITLINVTFCPAAFHVIEKLSHLK